MTAAWKKRKPAIASRRLRRKIDQSGKRAKVISKPRPQAAQAANGLQHRWPAKIKVGTRYRRDFGDLPALARSINKRGGLIHPIAITPAGDLIAGERRLKAWQLPVCRFHDRPIPVSIIDIDSILRGEADENDPLLRKPFSPSEAVALARVLRPRMVVEARERQREGGRTKASGKLPEAKKGEVRETIAKATGKSARSLDKAEAVVAAAERQPEKFGKLVEAMDRTGRVNGPYRRLVNTQASDRIKAEPSPLPMYGPYRAGVVDIPWASEPGDADKDHGTRGYYPYPTMTPEQAAVMQLPSILHTDAAVWLWITNFHLMHGHHLTIAKAWGLKPVALLTWIKRKWGQGQRVRGATEHLIQLVRGDVLCLGGDTRTWFEGEGGAHSQKPAEVYAIIEKLSPAPRYFELFSRAAERANWDLHGNEIGKLAREAHHKGEIPAPLIVTAPSDLEIPEFLDRRNSGAAR